MYKRQVVACGNGTAGIFAPDILRGIGCEVIELDCNLDWTFPKYNPNPEDLEMLHAIAKAVKESSMSCVQGHFHTVSEIKYVANDFHLNWGMSTGCLIDKKSLAMAYMKVNLAKPVLSCGVITEGIPYIVPMVLNSNGSWDNNIYL